MGQMTVLHEVEPMTRISSSARLGGMAVLALSLFVSAELAGQQPPPKDQQNQKKKKQASLKTPPNPATAKSTTQPKSNPATPALPANPLVTGPTVASGQPFPSLNGLGTPSVAGVAGYYQRYY